MIGAWDDDDDDREYYEDAALDCDHMEAEVDILTGQALCHCGYSWWLTGEELKAEIARQAEAYEAYLAECEQTNGGAGK